MSSLSNIPSQAVVPLRAYDRDALRKAAERADQSLLKADCRGARDRRSVLEEISRAFALPRRPDSDFGALYESVTDLQPKRDAEHPGFVVFLENLPDTPDFGRQERDALLDVFREAADYFFDRKTAFRVFYSIHDTLGDRATR